MKNYEYNKLILNVDFKRQDFIDIFGANSTFPQVIDDNGTIIGGATDTVKYLKSKGLV